MALNHTMPLENGNKRPVGVFSRDPEKQSIWGMRRFFLASNLDLLLVSYRKTGVGFRQLVVLLSSY